MKLYKLPDGILHEYGDRFHLIKENWDKLINHDNLFGHLHGSIKESSAIPKEQAFDLQKHALAPIGKQEVWAAGVTYLRSRDARMEESKQSGGANFYDKVYDAERPELFFKALPQRVAGPGQKVYIRRDSDWNVPEPELTLFINSRGAIQGYTVGNDMSSRSIESENPLYLPQAKVYEKSAALGPCLYVPEKGIDPEARIDMSISRHGVIVFKDGVSISRMRRSHQELADFLFRESDYPSGVFLMTGTCVVPPNDFTLKEDDRVDISIGGIGHLTNLVSYKPN
jgi:2-dehydro-3-deoxy-D-arabinonate dehydratase